MADQTATVPAHVLPHRTPAQLLTLARQGLADTCMNQPEGEIEMTATTTVPGVTQGSRCCWVVTDRATGKPYEAEEIPHFNTMEEARDSMVVRADADPRQLDEPCWTVVAECGEVFEADGMHLHFPSVEMARRDLDACGWKVVDGRLCCEECGEECGRD